MVDLKMPDERTIPFLTALLKPIYNPGRHGAHVVHARRAKR